MFVQRVIEWISPQNKSETPENCMETTSQNGKDEEEELTNCKQTLKTEENDANSSEPHEQQKKEGTTFLEFEDAQQPSCPANGAGGDGFRELPRVPKLSPLCMRILQRPEVRSSKRNIFTQTDNKRSRGKVVMKASVTRISSSASRVGRENMKEEDSPSINCKNPKITTRSCENLKESFVKNVVKKHGLKDDAKALLNDAKRVDPTALKMEEIPYKNLNKAMKKGFSYFDELKGFYAGAKRAVQMSSEDDITRSRVATLLREAVEKCYHKDLDSNIYGELLVLGSEDGTSRVSSRFVLRKRQKASGVKEMSSATYVPPLPIRKHMVSFQVSASRSVVVEYVRDTTSDMFQMGRHEHPPIDIRVANINNGRKGVSRFACRLVVQRHGHPRKARLYAAAFDASGNIFLGEEAVANFRSGGDMDGFTTNGVHLLHPGGEWREVSVRGRLYQARAPGEPTVSRRPVQQEENVLQDGTLIDLCGVTLLWRTSEGLLDAPDENCLDRMDCLLNDLAPECQRRNGPLTGELHCCGENERRAFVFLSCGHVVSMAVRLNDTMEGWSCPECRCIGPVACLRVGREPGFYADRDLPSHAFRPCGHVATLRTVRYWSEIAMPPHRNGLEKGVCPFCAIKLHPINKYVALIYPSQ